MTTEMITLELKKMTFLRLRINFHSPFSFLLVLLLHFLPVGVSGQAGWQSVSSGVVNPYNTNGGYVMASYGNIIYAGIGTSVYKWDGNGWTALGTGPVLPLGSSGKINSLITDAVGNVYAAGWFTDANGNYYVAKWDGHSWTEVGTSGNASPFSSSIFTIAADGAGNIYATGQFTNNIGQSYIAKWNGTSWGELKSNTSALNANSTINCITTDAAGNVYAAGGFTDAGNKKYVAKWNGTRWSEVGTGAGALNANNYIYSIVALPNGNMYAAGYFTDAGGHLYVAKWNGTSWSALPYIPSSYIYYTVINNLHADAAGNIYTGGGFTDQSGYVYVAKSDGTSWTEIGSGIAGSNANGNISSFAFDSNGNIYTAGFFTNTAGLCYVAEWNKVTDTWGEVGVNGIGELKYSAPEGLSYAVVSPNNIYTINTNNIYQSLYQLHYHWNGKYWSSVQLPVFGSNIFSENYYSIIADTKGNVYLSGYLDDGNNGSYFGKWDGTSWTRLDTVGGFSTNHPNMEFDKMFVDSAGDIYGTGSLSRDSGIIDKWDGVSWSQIKYQQYAYNAATQSPLISDIAVDGAGNLYAGLYMDVYGANDPGYFVGKWNGSSWVSLGTLTNHPPFEYPISPLAVDKLGNVYASGQWFDWAARAPMNGIQEWNGATWTIIDNTPYVRAMEVDANNNFYATGVSANQNIVRVYLDSVWHELGANTQPLNANNNIWWLGSDSYGNIYAAGGFTNSDGYLYLARYGTNGLLPVKFLNFTGYLNKGNAILNWQTATEINADHFNVERSIDGVHFTTVGRVMALGNSGSVANYSFTDPLTALDPSVLKIYYRLAAVDKDGATTYTNIVRLVINETNSNWGFSIYPVPVKNILQLQLINTTGKSTVLIFDAQGKKVAVQEIDKLNAATTPINVAALSHGLYFLQVLNNGESKTVKFIK